MRGQSNNTNSSHKKRKLYEVGESDYEERSLKSIPEYGKRSRVIFDRGCDEELYDEILIQVPIAKPPVKALADTALGLLGNVVGVAVAVGRNII